MARKPKLLISGFFAAAFVLALGYGAEAPLANATADTATATGDAEAEDSGSTLLSTDELNTLVAPAALYPDEFLAVVLLAATNPLQIVGLRRAIAATEMSQ